MKKTFQIVTFSVGLLFLTCLSTTVFAQVTGNTIPPGVKLFTFNEISNLVRVDSIYIQDLMVYDAVGNLVTHTKRYDVEDVYPVPDSHKDSILQKKYSPDTLVLDGDLYTFMPKILKVSLVEGTDSVIRFAIYPIKQNTGKHSYCFSVYGYGEGFPGNAVIVSEHNGCGVLSQVFYAKVNTKVFTLATPRIPQTFMGKLKVNMFHSNPSQGKFMYLPIQITIIPRE